MNRTQLLISQNVGGSHLAGETGIFGNVLKIPTAQRAALDIHSGAKQNTHILSLTLVAQNFAKKMIVNCLTKRVDVYRDYKLHIDLEQFSMGLDQSPVLPREKGITWGLCM